ncbi:MAG: toll/interleukin-1 receptor domain-containing protein [Desulfobacteraceae bacterium]|nr:toll/interleukin-1 receptor domain-containing protein [Desulfobacteraceae bacterium]
MANKKHLAILRQGVGAWNKWREGNSDVEPDLQFADLRLANLQGADLQRASLQGTDLRGANLQEANLREANLENAIFNKADFRRAELQKANLCKADFQEADLREADLQEAVIINVNLQKANLQGADMKGAVIADSDFENADLMGANLLEANIRNIIVKKTNLQGVKIGRDSVGCIPANIKKVKVHTWFILGEADLISRSIEFPPEYHQAGISILNYFSTVLRKKYPDIKAKIRIEQEDLKVTMTIDTLEGDREIIEQALDEYGLVVTGKMLLEEFTDDRLLKIELESKLTQARAEIETQKLLLQYHEREIKKQDEQLKDKSEGSARKDSQIEKRDIQIDRLLNLLESGLKPETKKQLPGIKVFISCAEDDRLTANKIYADLQEKDMIPWVAHKDINAGERTEFAVRRTIKDSDYFLALLSTSSVNERGMFQKELKQAFDILAEHPQDGIFIIPVRLDDCNTNNEVLSELCIIDMHKASWNSGMERIMQTLKGFMDMISTF